MIYLDNAATTKPSEAAAKAMLAAAEYFGNPSSLHRLGIEAEKLVTAARKSIASKLGVKDKQILFTSGGTEANNTFIFGAARARKKRGMKLVTSSIEHPSVLEAFRELEKDGYTVTYVGTDSSGIIDMSMLSDALDSETTLVSIMHVNNETGVIQPVAEISKLIREKAPNACFHSDCVQSFGKIEVNALKLGVDALTVSAHKIHGFKGTGALYVADTRLLRPLLYGGEQQYSIRPGTENVGGILAFGAAAEETVQDRELISELRNTMRRKLSDIPDIQFNGSDEYNSGSILNVSFIGIRAEVLMHALSTRGIYVSTGSACSSHKPQPSRVLTAMGLDKKAVAGAVRISFDCINTLDEVTAAAEIICEETAKLRRHR